MALVARIIKKGRGDKEASGDIPGRVLVATFQLWAEGHLTNARVRNALGLESEDENGMLILKNAYDALTSSEERASWLYRFSNVTQALEERIITASEASIILGL